MRRRFAAIVFAATSLAAGSAYAQSPEDTARADALFNEGKALLKDGNDADACARFAASKQLDPAVGVTLYLADCFQRIGRTASAWTEFRSAETLARDRRDKRADLARRRAQALEPALERITIEVAPSLAQTSLQISRDGKPVPPEEWGVAVPVDPGDHAIVARSGRMLRAFEAHVDANDPTTSIRIEQLSEEKPVVAETVPRPEATTSNAEKPAPSAIDAKRLWISLGLVGAGAVGIGVGLGFGIMAKSDRDESNAGPCNSADQCSAKGLSLRHEAINEALVSTIAFAAGAAALGASAVLAFAIPHGSKGTGLVVTPARVTGGAGALVQGRF